MTATRMIAALAVAALASPAIAQDAEAPVEATTEASELVGAGEADQDFLVALGVCGARITALERFYRGAIESGQEEWADSADNLLVSKNVMIENAEARAAEGQDVAVRVMNDQIPVLWQRLASASQRPGNALREEHDAQRDGVVECLDLFFERDG